MTDENNDEDLVQIISDDVEEYENRTFDEISSDNEEDNGEGGTDDTRDTPPPSPIDTDTVVAGISSAYGINPAEIQPEAEVSSSKDEKPKEKPKKDKDDFKEKDIMAVFWNMILKAYAWCIDKAVDIPIEFLEWVLYAKPVQEKAPKGDSWLDITNVEKKSFIKNIDKTNKNAKTVHEEINKNVCLIAAGEQASWSNLANINAGSLGDIKRYTEDVLVPAYRCYQINPDAPEARAYVNFNKIPEILEKSGKKIKMIGSLAYSLAAIKILADEDTGCMPDGFLSKYNELKKKMSARTIDYVGVGNVADELAATIPADNTFDAIREHVRIIKQKTTTLDKNSILSQIEAMNKNISEDKEKKYKRAKITKNSTQYIDKILANFDKIYENCGTDVDKRNETIRSYYEHINKNIASVASVASQADVEVKSKIAVSDKKRKKLQNALDAVDSFEFDGRPIGAYATAARRSQNIFENQRIIYDYMVGRI